MLLHRLIPDNPCDSSQLFPLLKSLSGSIKSIEILFAFNIFFSILFRKFNKI